MIEAVTEENLSEFENYIKLNPRGSYLQGSLWARQNPAWHWRAYIRRNEYRRVTGAVSFLVKAVPVLPYQIIYVGRGPVHDLGDYDTLRELLEALRTAAKEEQASIVRLDPPEDESDVDVMDIYETYDYEKLKHRGTRPVHPRNNWIVDTGKVSWAKLQQRFSREQAQNIRIALRHNVDIRRGGKALAGAFGRMVEQAALRDTRMAETSDFFSSLMDAYGNLAKIYLAFVDNRPVAGMVMVLTGTRYECVARVDLGDPALHAVSLLQAAVIQAAADSGYDSVSFPGTGPNPESPVYIHDSGFGGRPEKLIGELDWYVKPLLGMTSRLLIRISGWIAKKTYFIRIR